MLKIKVTHHNGRPASIVADFGEAGGTIGRGADSTLVLPDDRRHISRLQASIRFHSGSYVLKHHGATDTFINGRAVDSGVEVPLRDEDEIRIGEYTMRVTVRALSGASAPAPSTDPFADPPTPQQSELQPVHPFAGQQAPFEDPFASRSPASAERTKEGANTIPTNYDPAADFKTPPIAGSGAAGDFVQERDFAPEPDYLQQRSPVQRDDSPILASPFSLPRVQPAPAAWAEDIPESEEDTARGRRARKTPDSVPTTSRPPHAAGRASSPRERAGEAVMSADAPTVQVKERSSGPDELLQAFLKGCGLAELQSARMTPEFMEHCGNLLHEAVSGTLDLLRVRTDTKRSMRTDVTVIAEKRNNSLKFSPTAEAALGSLLAPRAKGFTAPVDAMRDAYNDLRSHEIALMAGMRAALNGLLSRFDPSQLEQRFVQKSALDALLPNSRQARLWELYEGLYRDILKEAAADFDTLFGREFLRVYEEQIGRLEQKDKA